MEYIVTWRGQQGVTTRLSQRLKWQIVRTIASYSRGSPIRVTVIVCNHARQRRDTYIVPVEFEGSRMVIVGKRQFTVMFRIEDVVHRVAARILLRNRYYRL
jgi:hypothetical protein